MENEGASQANLAATPARPRSILLLAALLGGNVALALGPWFVRMADTGPVSAGFWRLFLALPFLMLFARARGQRLTGMGPKTLALVALGAVTFALDLASWHIGIGMTRLGNATLFGNAGSIVLLFWMFIAHRMLPRRLEWLAIIFALAGAAILMGRSLEISTATLVGDLFCLAAGLLYAVYLLTLQRARGQFGSWSLLVWVCLFGCPVLLAIALALGEPVWPTDWTPLIGLFIVSQLLGQGLLVYALGHFPPLVIGLALLTQPAVASLYGWLAFGEVLSALDIIGMALVGTALAVARGRSS
ncbi:DMT family transporter [Erythrobacter sanguineus]|jgi:drug/metabolite transporter (DMT)-like permease|uniref:Threonine/homoserine efflux transporter RhtA n=1 Tax=Erythrobacter sanguineus TaxID=198312 RepID=A0A1M7RX80_9SPHN|nr:DMT family transporter [Erythrobacter sanguineus]MCR9179436.1 DMT family transporter [Erythrobacteraceae bacterium]SHN50885.1 Threonine/homoserine efflux transporter RhtA [Erythrobacter sanguineus]